MTAAKGLGFVKQVLLLQGRGSDTVRANTGAQPPAVQELLQLLGEQSDLRPKKTRAVSSQLDVIHG